MSRKTQMETPWLSVKLDEGADSVLKDSEGTEWLCVEGLTKHGYSIEKETRYKFVLSSVPVAGAIRSILIYGEQPMYGGINGFHVEMCTYSGDAVYWWLEEEVK